MTALFSKGNLADYFSGWIIGNFEPSILNSNELEVAIKRFKLGDKEPCHFQLEATEITIVVSGSIVLAGFEIQEGEILEIPPLVHGAFEARSDCTLLVIKFPSVPDDKQICEESH